MAARPDWHRPGQKRAQSTRWPSREASRSCASRLRLRRRLRPARAPPASGSRLPGPARAYSIWSWERASLTGAASSSGQQRQQRPHALDRQLGLLEVALLSQQALPAQVHERHDGLEEDVLDPDLLELLAAAPPRSVHDAPTPSPASSSAAWRPPRPRTPPRSRPRRRAPRAGAARRFARAATRRSRGRPAPGPVQASRRSRARPPGTPRAARSRSACRPSRSGSRARCSPRSGGLAGPRTRTPSS